MKQFYSLNLLAVVLIFGLISCSPDKKIKDLEFSPALPLILKSESSMDLKAYDASSKKELSPSDKLDWRAAQADRVYVETVCQNSAEAFKTSSSPPPDEAVTIFKILPEEVLLMDLNQKEIHCSISLSLWNKAGARHVFFFQGRILGEPPTEIELEKNGLSVASDPAIHLQQKDLSGLQMRFSRSSSAFARWSCQDFNFEDLPFYGVTELSHFDPHNIKIRPGHPKFSIELRPVQYCRLRVLSAADNLPVAVSSRFKVTMVRSTLNLKGTKLVDRQNPKTVHGLYSKLFNSPKPTKLKLYSIRLSNSSLMPRQIRLAPLNEKTAAEVSYSASFFVPQQFNQNSINQMFSCTSRVPALYWETDVAPIKDEKAGRVFVIEPLGEVELQLAYQADRSLMTVHHRLYGLRIPLQEIPTIEDLDADGQKVGDLTFDLESIQLGAPSKSPPALLDSQTSCQKDH